MSKNKTKAAVIGSGFGGLTLAIRLQLAGFETVIFEKRDMAGGRAYVYKDKGFTFDAGPTVITAPHVFEDLFKLAGKKMSDYFQLMPVTPFYRLFWEDGIVFDYSNDEKKTFEQIEKLSPCDVQGYKDFLKYSEEVFHEGYTKLVHVPFLNIWSMVKVSPQLLKLQAFRSVYSIVSKYIKNEYLRQAFSFHSLLVGGNPFSTSSIYTLIHYLERTWGVYFPKGGTGALVNGLVRLFTELGGKIYYNSEVDRVITKSKRVQGVRLKGEDRDREFEVVVSNAEIMHTYQKLLGDEPVLAQKRKRLEKMNYSMSLFLIYFGTNKKYSDLAHHNILFGPRYKGLLNDIFKSGNLSEDFSLYLHAPSVSDPDLAPKNSEAFYVLSPVPHLGNGSIDWKIEGEKYAQKIIDYLDERYLPDLKKHIVTQRIFTPLDFQSTLNSHLGAAFSLEPILTQSAYFRAHNRDDDIKGLYVVGAGTHPGAGVPGVVNSARATAGVIYEDSKKYNWRTCLDERPELFSC